MRSCCHVCILTRFYHTVNHIRNCIVNSFGEYAAPGILYYQLICTLKLSCAPSVIFWELCIEIRSGKYYLLELKAPQPCTSHALTLLLWCPAQRTLQAPTTQEGKVFKSQIRFISKHIMYVSGYIAFQTSIKCINLLSLSLPVLFSCVNYTRKTPFRYHRWMFCISVLYQTDITSHHSNSVQYFLSSNIHSTYSRCRCVFVLFMYNGVTIPGIQHCLILAPEHLSCTYRPWHMYLLAWQIPPSLVQLMSLLGPMEILLFPAFLTFLLKVTGLFLMSCAAV